MKNFKKIASAIAALSLAACMVAPVATMTSFADEPATTYSITIKAGADSSSDATHSYVAYQIFKGDLSGTGEEGSPFVLSNPAWGNGVNADAALTAAKGISELSGCTTVADIVKKLGENTTRDNDVARAFAAAMAGEGVLNNENKITGSGNTISGLTPGYYLVMDSDDPTLEGTAAPNSSARTRYILEVVGKDLDVTAKVAAPTVDKQVWDDDNGETGATSGDDGYWGETADHEMNETFKFKLTATIPTSPEIDEYKSYKLIFHDSWSAGVTYDGGIVLKVGTETISLSGDFTTTGEDSEKGVSWSVDTEGNKLDITINDLKALAGSKALSEIETVEVIYDAHLNDGAEVEIPGADQTTANKNTVNLEYSNNPNTAQEGKPGGDTGKTPDDSVWVFTYEVPTLKTGEGDDEDHLGGAKFQLSPKDGGSPLTFTKTGDKYYYDPEGDVTDLESSSTDGTFNIVGLDAGTYTLTETFAPAGYNKAAPIYVTITATHSEDADVGKVTMTLGAGDKDSVSKVEINDQKGASLPSTGGIGTTLFYLGGGALVAVAGVMLITKKRMTKE